MLDADEVAMVGMAVLENALREMKQGGYTQRWLPVFYQCDGVSFRIYVYLNMVDDNEPDGLVFAMHTPIDLTKEIHQDCVQVAFWLYDQINTLSLVLMFVGKNGLDTGVCGNTSEQIKHYQSRVTDLKLLDIYPALPHTVKQQIQDAIETCRYAHQEALSKEAEERNKAWWAAMRASPKHGYIYLIQSVTGAYKIGRTKNPDDRIKTFSVKLPFEVEYVCVVETENMYYLERELHRQFDTKRINGEWFKLSENDVSAIKALAAVYHGR